MKKKYLLTDGSGPWPYTSATMWYFIAAAAKAGPIKG